MARIRGIFAKLVFVFLTVGLVPFLAVGLWTWRQAKTRVTEASVESWLVRIARETAAQIDRETERMREAALAWADEEQTVADARAAARPGPDGAFAAQRLTSALGRRAELFGDVPVACVVSPDGRILAANGSDRSLPASALGGRRLDEVFDDAAERAWIDAVFAQPAPGPVSRRNWHRSPLADAAVSAANPSTRRHEIGFAAPVRGGFGAPDGRPAAALVVLFRFEPIQRVLDQVTGRFADHAVDDAAPRYPSGYPFLFDADGDTVIAHRDRALVGSSLVRDHGQRGFSEAMRGRRYGFHHYEYPPGVGKISGFARCADEASGGFGWIVGVGVNHADVFADVDALRDVLLPAALIIAGCVLLLAALFSARITEPLRRLVLFTEQVARGNYDARVEPTTRDELAVVADAFNRMAADLKESGRRLIEAEKNAAWKEMARQVAHEIKNPLTP
ncbi:MAG TPA: HAMP domain-containing protein, partial [Planctomycetota bacterium]|nr:HAMP domain-containing protein [Planctomycetota bacterium]